MIKNSGLSYREFYEQLGIKKAYFYDIIGDRTNPPPPEKQFEIIKILKPTNDDCYHFFELAAKGRNEFPADLQLIIDEKMKAELRNIHNYQQIIGTKKQV